MHPKLPEETIKRARVLRGNQTDAEALLWMFLKNRGLGGFKFRRQHPAGRFFLDFYCESGKLGIELDGGQHNDDAAAAKDEWRTRLLNQEEIQVIRFWNHEVLRNTEAVLEKIYLVLVAKTSQNLPHPFPSPGGRGDS